MGNGARGQRVGFLPQPQGLTPTRTCHSELHVSTDLALRPVGGDASIVAGVVSGHTGKVQGPCIVSHPLGEAAPICRDNKERYGCHVPLLPTGPQVGLACIACLSLHNAALCYYLGLQIHVPQKSTPRSKQKHPLPPQNLQSYILPVPVGGKGKMGTALKKKKKQHGNYCQ